ncbi:hypothetical protein [Deinococcus sedimenti]|uniref:Uncharacterized protein n=1 Tax=Deinococcus sedimenti TaxID=1867090 RepID=A0ABQ2S7Q3_9DEIO|nr:hypothetical protein [Deinococcus sedimenti]GGS05751.1 hypothetical protein GCM10008960_35320 [Deinococcus sedimenti]
MPTSERFAPYAMSTDVSVQITSCIDRDAGTPIEFTSAMGIEDVGSMVYELVSPKWKTLEMQVGVTLPHAELQKLAPPESDLDTETRMIVRVTCPSTKLRRGVELTAVAPGRWEGTVTLRRSSVDRDVKCDARLVRILPGPPGAKKSFALAVGQILAEGQSAVVRLQPPKPRLNAGMDVRWEDFQASHHEWRSKHPQDVFYLDTGAEEPVVWLNSNHKALHAALETDDAAGTSKAVKLMTMAFVAQAVWHQMFLVAAADLTTSPDDSPELPEGWKGNVLNELLPRLFPLEPEDERLPTLLEKLRNGAAAGSLASLLGTAIQEQIGGTKMIRDAVRAIDEGEE